MKYQETKVVENLRHTVNVRLNDECNNGHQDFAVTVDTYKKRGKRWREYAFGCQHDVVKEHFPHLSPFVALHLCDYTGVPMHAIANGYYHLVNGFNSNKADDAGFVQHYQEYYRLTDAQYYLLADATSAVHFAMILRDSDILKCWKADADEAIKLIEQLTGKEFVNSSTRTNLTFPSPEKVKEEEERHASGYYTPEAQKDREEAKKAATIEKWKKAGEFWDIYKQEKREIEVKTQLLLLGGEHYVDNTIIYKHDKSVEFNWLGFGEKLTAAQIDQIKETVKLPKGYRFK